MKFKIFSVASLALMIVVVGLSISRFNPSSVSNEENPVVLSKQQPDQNSKTIKIGDYSAVWFKVVDTDLLTLKSNLRDLLPSSEMACDNLVNAGFYTPNFTHSGLFISEGQEVQEFVHNKTYNAIFSVNDLGTPRITRDTPKDSLRFAVQTGPMLIENAEVLKLSLIRDKPARRMIAAVTGANETIFVAIFNSDSAFEGPLLAELPELVDLFGEIIGEIIADAINLDGGSASAFYNDNYSLTEISTIGGYFCVST